MKKSFALLPLNADAGPGRMRLLQVPAIGAASEADTVSPFGSDSKVCTHPEVLKCEQRSTRPGEGYWPVAGGLYDEVNTGEGAHSRSVRPSA